MISWDKRTNFHSVWWGNIILNESFGREDMINDNLNEHIHGKRKFWIELQP